MIDRRNHRNAAQCARLARIELLKKPAPGTFTNSDLRQYRRLLNLCVHKNHDIRVIAFQDLAAFRARMGTLTMDALDAALDQDAAAQPSALYVQSRTTLQASARP